MILSSDAEGCSRGGWDRGDRPGKCGADRARDYLDVAARLRTGLTINDGVGALLALYGSQASGLQSVKTTSWFGDGDLDRLLPADVKSTLLRAASDFEPHTLPLVKRSTRLDAS